MATSRKQKDQLVSKSGPAPELVEEVIPPLQMYRYAKNQRKEYDVPGQRRKTAAEKLEEMPEFMKPMQMYRYPNVRKRRPSK